MKNARDFCIAITKSWELRNIEGLSDIVKRKMMDSAYISYRNLVYRTIYGIESVSQKVHVLKMLRKMAPDLKFSNNSKQLITTFLFKHTPCIVIYLMLVLKVYKSKHLKTWKKYR